jgi:hypothetical protein
MFRVIGRFYHYLLTIYCNVKYNIVLGFNYRFNVIFKPKVIWRFYHNVKVNMVHGIECRLIIICLESLGDSTITF